MDILMNMLKNKKKVLRPLIKIGEDNTKYANGLRKLKDNPNDSIVVKLIEVMAIRVFKLSNCLFLFLY